MISRTQNHTQGVLTRLNYGKKLNKFQNLHYKKNVRLKPLEWKLAKVVTMFAIDFFNLNNYNMN